MDIKDKLKAQRLHKGMTQLEVADLLGIGHASYSRYESGLREPNLEMLDNLAKVFGVSITSFFNKTYPDDSVEFLMQNYISIDEEFTRLLNLIRENNDNIEHCEDGIKLLIQLHSEIEELKVRIKDGLRPLSVDEMLKLYKVK